MSEFIRHEYLLLKNKIKGPSWQLSGGLVFLGIALAVSLVNKNTNQPELEYLASPLKGDVYEYKTNDSQYSTMRVSEVSTDSLYLLVNQHKIDKASQLNWIDKVENYHKNTVAFERQKINDMYNEGKILAINRNK